MTRALLAALVLVSAALSGCAAGIGRGTDVDIRQPVSESGPMVGDPYERESPGSRR